MAILTAIGQALAAAFDMFWEVLWPLVLGFGLSAVVQALVSHRALARVLGDDSPRSLALATPKSVASSSCSYAAVALTRSLFRKGASFTAAMVFELASTNLVVELGIIPDRLARLAVRRRRVPGRPPNGGRYRPHLPLHPDAPVGAVGTPACRTRDRRQDGGARGDEHERRGRRGER